MGTTETVNRTTTAAEHPVQQITTRTDSREILANARRDIARYGLKLMLQFGGRSGSGRYRGGLRIGRRLRGWVLRCRLN